MIAQSGHRRIIVEPTRKRGLERNNHAFSPHNAPVSLHPDNPVALPDTTHRRGQTHPFSQMVGQTARDLLRPADKNFQIMRLALEPH